MPKILIAFITVYVIDLILYCITPYRYTKGMTHAAKFLPISGLVVFIRWAVNKFKS